MAKTTDENYRKLQAAKHYEDAKLEGMIDRDFSSALDKMIRDKNLTTEKIVSNCTLSKPYINRLRNPSRKSDKPSRNAVINIALGMNATMEETNLLLKRARYQELYTRDKAESIIIWGMMKNLSGSQIRAMLAEKGLDGMFKEREIKKKEG